MFYLVRLVHRYKTQDYIISVKLSQQKCLHKKIFKLCLGWCAFNFISLLNLKKI